MNSLYCIVYIFYVSSILYCYSYVNDTLWDTCWIDTYMNDTLWDTCWIDTYMNDTLWDTYQ